MPSFGEREIAQQVRRVFSKIVGWRVDVLYDTHTAAIEGDSLADDFFPFGTHLYELDRP